MRLSSVCGLLGDRAKQCRTAVCTAAPMQPSKINKIQLQEDLDKSVKILSPSFFSEVTENLKLTCIQMIYNKLKNFQGPYEKY